MSPFQLKRLWNRWVTRHCTKSYSILPRRYRFLHERRNSDRSTFCKCCRGFYCVADPTLLLLLLTVILTIVVLHLRGVTIEDIMQNFGKGSYAVLTISILDWKDDVNFPGSVIITDRKSEKFPSNSSRYTNSDNAVIWKVDGFNKYMEAFKDDPDVLGMFGKLQSGKKLDKTGYGFWVYRFDPPKTLEENTDTASNGGIATISALRLMDHVDNCPDEIQVAVAIRAYMDGEATILVKYEDTLSKHVYTEHIKKEEFKNRGFCYKILDVPSDKRINSIHIRPASTNLRRHGIVIVDKVLIVISTKDASQKFIYTLVPDNWC